MIDKHSFIQPTEFNQLDHERHFKLVFLKLFLATLSYALSALTLSHLTGEGKDTVRERTFSFYQARALKALGLLLADGTPTVGGGKTF